MLRLRSLVSRSRSLHALNFDLLGPVSKHCPGLIEALVDEVEGVRNDARDDDEQPKVITVIDLIETDEVGARRLRCLRCDERVVTYRTFSQLVSPLLAPTTCL